MITTQFKVLADLGAGATAEVKLVQDVNTGEKFACKVIKTGPKGISGQALTDVQKEVTIMSSMKHDYIINTKAVGRGPYDKLDGNEPEEVLFILMEYAPEGELFDMIANSGKFSEPTARYFFMQLLSALSYIHN
jgi:serine/threonine protein kinase